MYTHHTYPYHHPTLCLGWLLPSVYPMFMICIIGSTIDIFARRNAETEYSVTLFCCQLSPMHQRQHKLCSIRFNHQPDECDIAYIWLSWYTAFTANANSFPSPFSWVCTRRKNTHTYNKQRTYQKNCYRNRRNKAMYVCTREDFDRCYQPIFHRDMTYSLYSM